MTNIFISRAGEDREIAKWIKTILATAIVQDYDFHPGHNFARQISQALDQANHVIPIFSPHYFAKPYCLMELYAAIVDDPIGEKRLVIPIRTHECEVPRLFKPLVYIDFVNKDEPTRRQLLLDALGTRTAPATKTTYRAYIGQLPTVHPTLIGRTAELAFLDLAWLDPETNFVQIIAPGGTGKTALMTTWFHRYVDRVTIYGWSFYSQGTSEDRQTSSDAFFNDILRRFKIPVREGASIFEKVDLLTDHLNSEKVLLILDGIEPLQDADGGLRDVPLKTLLKELATRNEGMVLCTTRIRITDLPDDEPCTRSLDLDNLDPLHGAEYLAHLGVKGTVEELCEASADFSNLAQALTLLGTYLVDFCEADVRRRVEIREPLPGADRMIAAYARMYAGRPELAVLQALGYFDRPAEPEALKLVLPDMKGREYQAALNSLYKARLILTRSTKEPIDCHPLIREYFGPTSTAEGHSKLYEHYCNQAPHQPDTLEKMTPLFYAVHHGCKAGRHQQALNEVYHSRILRGSEAYLVKKLGAFGTNLSLIANFFQFPWTQAIPTLGPANRSWVLGTAAFTLRALGRLDDAVKPMRAGAQERIEQEAWKNAANGYGNLSELLLTIGNVDDAIAAARKSVELADRSGDARQRMGTRTTLADALHQSGNLDESERLFEEAKPLQAERQPAYPILYSLWGYRYCDLLLAQGKASQVMSRAATTLGWARQYLGLLDVGLDHLSLGRAYARGSPDSATHLNQAVEYLRRAGHLDHLPRALLARATPRDLAEVYTIATRCGMRLHLTDYHLAMARIHKSREHLEKAAALIAETGYHRRDPELETLKTLC